jgi:hypothetical protein
MKRTTGSSQKPSRASYWGGMLFGLLSFGVGAGFLLLGVIPGLWDAVRMRDWVQVPAEVVQLDLKSNHSDDTTTYKVIARFRYVYDGRSYTGNRVGIDDGGSDNVGDWQHDTCAKASLWFARGFAIFWNAISSPVLFAFQGELARGNQMRWIALLFPLVGLGLLVWAMRQTLGWRRFGMTLLGLDPFPGAIGGDVGGTVELRLPYNPKHGPACPLDKPHRSGLLCPLGMPAK